MVGTVFYTVRPAGAYQTATMARPHGKNFQAAKSSRTILPDGQPLSRWEHKRLALGQRDVGIDMDRFQQDAPSGDRITDDIRYWVSKLAEPQ
jgi:hypothetical protein